MAKWKQMEYILCIGYQKEHVGEVNKALKADEEIIIIEEKTLISEDLIKSKHKYYLGEYQQSYKAVEIATGILESSKIVAVIPIREYAVPVAYAISRKLGLNGIGELASKCLRDKFKLRETVSKYAPINFVQPQYTRVNTEKNLQDFFSSTGPCVIKPSSKQSTVGVFVIKEESQINKYYRASLQSDEPGRIVQDRTLDWQYQAEVLLPGNEFSTELFVKDCKILFFNGTIKKTHNGSCPYEIGHSLPLCAINPEVDIILSKAAAELIKILKVENGIIHAEWMVSEENIVGLIEAAGRAPGGFITDLISNTFQFNFFRAWIDIMKGEGELRISDKPHMISSMRWLNPKNGIVKKINDFKDRPVKHFPVSILKSEISLSEGDMVDIKNNQTRVGYVIAEMDELVDSVIVTEEI